MNYFLNNKNLKKLIYSALFLAVGMFLPFLTGQIPQIGNMLLPLHIPVLLCGFLCGWPYGLALGAILPVFRSLIFGMPPIYPVAIAMTVEMATYGLLSGLIYNKLSFFSSKIINIYLSLITAMIGGRILWGFAQLILMGVSGKSFPVEVFLNGAVLTAIPGILLQLILIPVLVLALEKYKVLGRVTS